MSKYIIWSIIIYLVVVALYFLAQRSFIYQPRPGYVAPSVYGLNQINVIKLYTKDGLTLKAWYHQAMKNKPTIIYFPGNSGNLTSRIPIILPFIKSGYGVLLVGYRGYSGNPGKPSEHGLYQDARAAFKHADQMQIPITCRVLYGESLGSGVAIQMATEFPVAAIVLRAPFTSLTDVAKYHYPYLPVDWLLQDRFESDKKIGNIYVPIFIFHGESDYVIPTIFSQKLYAFANSPKRRIVLRNTGHNQMPDTSAEIIKFLNQHIHCRHH